MLAIIISDLHLTDSPVEQYRWDVFDWAEAALKEHKANTLFILGDIFDRKDRHPSSIVNKLAAILNKIAATYPIYVLKGNHDYLNPSDPFLAFLDLFPHIIWIDDPTSLTFENKKTLWLPHNKNPTTYWSEITTSSKFDMVFMHQSVIGCKTSNAYEMNCGLDLAWLEERVQCPIISGDIHVPQTIRSLTYVGTQHPVSFGDDYECRALLLNFKNLKVTSLPISTIHRHSISISNVEELQQLYEDKILNKGDHAKIRIVLSAANLSEWSTLKIKVTDWCAVHKVELFDIKLEKVVLGEAPSVKQSKTGFVPVHPTLTLQRYLENESIDPKISEVGKRILAEVLNEQ